MVYLVIYSRIYAYVRRFYVYLGVFRCILGVFSCILCEFGKFCVRAGDVFKYFLKTQKQESC